MRTVVALCVLAASTAMGASPPPPLDESIVSTLVKQGMSEAQVRASYDACDSGGPISMKICFRYRLEGERIRLADAYAKLQKAMLEKDASARSKSLERAQDAWEKYRDLQCSLEGDMSSFDFGAVLLACEWSLTKLRADSIVETLSWYAPSE